jgi:AraC-like DNA-binding protein
MLRFKRYAPGASVSGVVSSYHVASGAPEPGLMFRDRMLPGSAVLRFQLFGDWQAGFRKGALRPAPPAMLIGYTTWPVEVATEQSFRVIGVGLPPQGWRRLIDRPADAYADQMVDLREIMGPSVDEVMVQLQPDASDEALLAVIEAFLRKRLETLGIEESPFIDQLERILATGEPLRVDRIADQLGLSERQLERSVARAFGCTPKLLIRKHRFLRAVAALTKSPAHAWLEAAGTDFYDQSHLIREFRRFADATPTEYLNRLRPHRGAPVSPPGVFMRSVGTGPSAGDSASQTTAQAAA